MSSHTYADTFTRTHGRRLSGRVTTDLRQSSILYGSPAVGSLEDYRVELEELLLGGFVTEYQFGYQASGRIVWSLRYVVAADGSLTGTGGAGGVPTGADVSEANWFNFLTPSASWYELDSIEKDAVNARLPFTRAVGSLPSDAHGYWASDRAYAAGGVEVQRAVFRSLS